MLNFLFLLNMIVSLGIAIFIFVNFIKNYKDNIALRKILFLFLIIGIIFLINSIIFLLWSFNVFVYSPQDFLIVHSTLTSIEAIILLIILYRLRNNKKIFYLLLIYLISISSIMLGWNVPHFFLISSLALMFMLFLLLISNQQFKRIAKFAIFYCSISLLLEVVFLLKNQLSPITGLVSNLFFFLFIFFFLIDLKEIPYTGYENKVKISRSNYFFDFLRYFIFIIILTNFVFIGTLAIHEAGHFFVAKMVPDCGLEKIVYEGKLPHTEILCDNSTNSIDKILLGGFLVPVIVALLFFFGGGKFMKETSFLIIGFDILIAYKDFIELGLSSIVSTIFSIFGAIVVILAILALAKSRTTEENFISLTGN